MKKKRYRQKPDDGVFRLTLSPKAKPKPKKTFVPNRFWADAIKVGQIGLIKPDCDSEMAGKRVMYVGHRKSGYWVKLLEDSATKQYPRGLVFGYLLKWVDWTK